MNQKISLARVEKPGDDVFKAFVIAFIVDILVEPSQNFQSGCFFNTVDVLSAFGVVAEFMRDRVHSKCEREYLHDEKYLVEAICECIGVFCDDSHDDE